MRACVLTAFGAVENLEIKDVAEPMVGPGQVLVDVHAAGVTHAELLVIKGKYQTLPTLPFIPGKELAGVVAAVGDGVASIRPGDRVMGVARQGAYAQRTLVSHESCFKLPAAMSFVQAAALGTAYQTAYFALMDHGRFRAGETVLINGASGGVGLAAVQFAKAKGAIVLAGLTTPAKAGAVLAHGADHVIDLSQPDIGESLRRQVHAVTGGRGVDIVIDMLGGDVFDASLRVLAWRGRGVVIGFVAGRIPAVKTNYLLIKNITVSGMFLNTYRANAPQEVTQAQQELFGLFGAGKLNPVVMECLPLDQVGRAFALIADRKGAGRVILDPNQ